MMNGLYDVDIVAEKIASGALLSLAGSEKALAKLPAGRWIGGSIPYFMAEAGGCRDDDKVFATEIADDANTVEIKRYTSESLREVYNDAPENGFSLIIIPAGSKAHSSFALEASDYPGFTTKPLVGWIAGVAVEDIGSAQPVLYDGTCREAISDGAVVMHVGLPAHKYAEISILNSFAQGGGDVIRFLEDGFSASKAIVNGETCSFVDYLNAHKFDARFPLVADYGGAMINTSFQKVDADSGEVTFYAPVFRGIDYRVAAAPHLDYVADFDEQIQQIDSANMLWSCNCILNYLYAGLEGKRTGSAVGPMTFGEIAYQLVNQTMVYLSVFEH